MISKEKNIMFSEYPHREMKNFSDEEVIEQLKEAEFLGWNINQYYGNEYDNYNTLHACAMNKHFKACEWLLKKGINPNLHSANDETAFTFIVGSLNKNKIKTKDFIDIAEKFKKYGADLSLYGYEDKSPLELYDKFNKNLDDEVIEYLVKHADFENTFLLNQIFTSTNLLTIKTLKVILKYHKIDLKKIKKPENDSQNSETYWDSIAFLNGSYFKNKFEVITWLHNKIGFDLENWHLFYDYDGVNNTKYHVNLLGLAIQNKNNNLFNWLLKRKPEYMSDTFFINDKKHTFLEYCLYCNFRKGIKMSLINMSKEELINLNMSKLKSLCKDHTDSLSLETFQKTYTALIYKKITNKYENILNTHKTKKLKI